MWALEGRIAKTCKKKQTKKNLIPSSGAAKGERKTDLSF